MGQLVACVVCPIAFVVAGPPFIHNHQSLMLVAGVYALLMMAFRLHARAIHLLVDDHYITLCFIFPYTFRVLSSVGANYIPHWAPACLWYSFLVQLLCGQASVLSFPRIGILLGFVAEGVSGPSVFGLLKGSQLIILSYCLAVCSFLGCPVPPLAVAQGLKL